MNRDRLRRNAGINRGLDNSEHVMMMVAAKLGKDKAHELLYDKAMKTELEGKDYYTVLLEDPTISSMFSAEELKEMIDPASYTGMCEQIARTMAEKGEQEAERLKKESCVGGEQK